MASTAVKQWGNSAGVRISKEILEKSNIQIDDVLDIKTALNGTITLQKRNKKKFSDFVEPLFDTKNIKFDRDEANER